MKKGLLIFLGIITLAGCNSNLSTLNNSELTNSSFVSQASFSRLPELPNNPLFAVFNNAYKGLAVENEEIGKNDPHNSDKYFFKVIESAQETLDVCFFDIDDPQASQAFIAAHNRGVKVRVVTDTDNLTSKENSLVSGPSEESVGTSRQSIEDLKAAGIEVKDDKRSAFMHHKFMVVDNKLVWMGSTNPTTTSMYDHNNNAVIIQSEKLAENYNQEFKRLFENEDFGFVPGPVPNPSIDINGDTVRTYFSPRGGTKEAILEELRKATKSIKFMAFSFTDKDMGKIMMDKKAMGLNVEGVFDSCLIDQYSMYSTFRKNKIYALHDGNQALMHHKTIIIDNKVVINGSFNFSNSAENSNNEDTLIINSDYFANVFNQEYYRVKNSALNNKDLPPYDHPACRH